MNATSQSAEPASEATVVTERAARYGKQLVNHLSRKSGGEWDEEKTGGWIQLGEHRKVKVQALGDSLSLQAEAPDLESLEKVEEVVGSHLVRFGDRDDLVVEWKRNDATDGTVQKSGDAE